MEKYITITQISAKFTKDFDSFGKMDPFLTFKLGSAIQKTQIAENAGKQPTWKATITLKANNDSQLQITAYDQDVTENQLMGIAKLDIKTFKNSGTHKIAILGQDNKSVGDVFFKYQIKQSKPVQNAPAKTQQKTTTQKIQQAAKKIDLKPVQGAKQPSDKKFPNSIKITQISAKFTKNFDTFGKMQPYLTFKIGQQKDKTQVIENNNPEIKWDKKIILGYNSEKQLKIKAYDQDVTQNQYMGMVIIPLSSLSKSGIHKAQLIGEDKQSIGSISFKYQITEPPKPDPVQQKKQVPPVPVQKPVQQPKPVQQKKPIQKPKPVQQKKPIQQPKPVQKAVQKPKSIEPKIQLQPPKKVQTRQQSKPAQIKLTDRVGQKLTQLSQKQSSQRPIDLNSSINKTLNKSRQSLKLPNIGDASKNFGDKIYEKQSSATLQKSILVYSMPKAQRFASGPKYVGEPSYYVDSCFKPNATKGVGFGFGNKRQFPEWMQKNMKENPAPGSYFQQPKIAMLRTKGPTFGISYKYYEKVTIPKQKSPEKERVVRSNQRLRPIIRTN